MSNRLKSLKWIGVFILSMAVVLILLLVTQPKDEVEDDTKESEGITVLSYDRDNIATMTITNESGSYTVQNGVKGFSIPEFTEFRQNSTTLGAAGRCATSLTAQALVEENAVDLSKYGLAENNYIAQVDITLKDGTAYTLYYGIDAPDEKTRYVRLSTSNDVYTVLLNSSNYFTYKKEDFLSLIVTDEISNNNVAPTIDWLTITRRDLDYDIKFEDDTKNYAMDEVSMASSQVMISPVYAYLDITNSNAIIYGLWGLQAEGIAKVHPTDADFVEYGLDDPFCTVSLDAELQKYTLLIGDVCKYQPDEDGNPTTTALSYYCYYKGIDIIYIMPSSEVPYTTFMPIDILSSMMTSNYIYALDYIDVQTFGDNAEHYYIDVNGSVEDQSLAASMSYQDGELVEYDPEDFKKLYQFMLKCPIDDICLEEPAADAETLAFIDFRRVEGDGDTLEFIDGGANRLIIKLNGVTSFSQPKSYLEVLIKNLALFRDGTKGDDLLEVW